MLARIALALPLGAAVTATLLFMMQLFIAAGHGESATTENHPVRFVRVERTEPIQSRRERPAKPEAQEVTPDVELPDTSAAFTGDLTVGLFEPTVDLSRAKLDGIDMTASDGEYLPVVKVAPVYPMRARQRRLEGYVIVEFVVTETGAVRDVIVVESSSPIFDEAAIEAALKFRYKPRVVDGTPIEVAGVQNRITFRLDV